jgi:hypothetical protein
MILNVRTQISVVTTIALGVFAGSTLAAVSTEEAKQLGGPILTEWGAERAGNKDGSIPAWTGEKVKIPASWDPKEPGRSPDPWNDKPLYTITAQNMGQYADKLSEGQKGMLKLYPGFRMDVYPTRRTVLFPKTVLENTIKNATSAKAANGGIRLEGAYAGIPFPIPKNGNEVIWNQEVTWAPLVLSGIDQSWSVANNGQAVLQGTLDVTFQFPYWDQSIPGIRKPDSAYFVLRFDALAPARKVGEKYVIINALDPINPGQRVWIYIPGQRRVKLAPDLAYDTPSPTSGGASTMDENKVFLGAQDRFDFKLVGKVERYILVNQQNYNDYKVCPPEKIFQKNFQNPDCTRFELHRTWHVEATLKPGFRNILPKRNIYVDEDWSGAAMGDAYDASGKLYRVEYAPIALIYDPKTPDVQYQSNQVTLVYDLQTGQYVNAAFGGFKEGNIVGGFLPGNKLKPATFFSPEALAGEGIR